MRAEEWPFTTVDAHVASRVVAEFESHATTFESTEVWPFSAMSTHVTFEQSRVGRGEGTKEAIDNAT